MQYNTNYFNDLNKIFINNNDVILLKNKSVFITGSTGLIGSSIADYLLFLNKNHNTNITIYLGARNYEKLCSRFSCYKEGIDYNYLNYNACNKIEFDISFDYVIHGAGNGDPLSISNNPVETIITNTSGLNDLLFYSNSHSVKKLLYISSSEIYGITNTNTPHKENDYGVIDAANIRACYPLSKKCGENLCISFSQEYNLYTTIVRPGHIYGPQITMNDSRATAQFIRNILNNNDIIMKSNGSQIRSYCYSLDCASAIIQVLIKGEKSTAYNISNPKSICSIKDFAEELALQSSHKVVYEISTEKEKKSYNMMNYSALNSQRLEALGWIPCFSLKEGISSTIHQI